MQTTTMTPSAPVGTKRTAQGNGHPALSMASISPTAFLAEQTIAFSATVGQGARDLVSVPVKVFSLVVVIVLACIYPGLAGEPEDRMQAIREAIRGNDNRALAEVLGRPGHLEARDRFGNTPLILAAHLGSPEQVAWILDQGADVNATDHTGATALLRGAGRPEIVGLLLARGARPNVATRIGHTPLMLAARTPGATESVRLLLAHGADVKAKSLYGATALMGAAAASNLEVARWLIERGADVNAIPMPETKGPDPIWGGIRTPLMWAAYRGNQAMAALLVEKGAQINQVTAFGTPLTQAAWRGDSAMTEWLVERGADVRLAEPFSGFTALHWAASTEDGQPDLVNLLVRHGADPKAEGGQPVDAFLGVPQTPEMLARQRGETAVARALGGGSGGRGQLDMRASYEGVATDGSAVAQAIGSALAPLQSTALVSRESFLRHASKQDCVSCHQQYFPMAAVGLAKTRRLPADEEALRQLKGMVLGNHRGAAVDLEPMFHPDAPHDYGYALLAIRSEGTQAPDVTDAMVHHLASIQGGDGRWNVNLLRPPMQSSDIAATALAVYALRNFGWPARSAEFDQRVQEARRWLARAKAMTHEEQVYQILGLHWAGVAPERWQGKLKRLMATQRADGGWAQLPGLETDAYATGQALYALRETGALSERHEVCQRAARYLLGSQGKDGTWHVKRRAFPLQPTMESGFPHGRDSWISATGTSWAVMALTTMMGPMSDRSSGADVVEAAAGTDERKGRKDLATMPHATSALGRVEVEFVRDIQPLLERSCVACHSGERARGNYRLTDRASMMSAGNQGIPAVMGGRSGESAILRYVTDGVSDLAMPPVGKRSDYPALTTSEVERLRAWIEGGAAWPEGVVLGGPQPMTLGSSERAPSSSRQP